MSCSDSILYIYAGATWREAFQYLDADDAVIPLTGLNARGVLRDSANEVVLTLDSAGGSPNLLIDEPTATVTTDVASDATPDLAEGGARTALTLHLELYDDGSTPEITPFGKYDVIVLPDEIP